MALKITDFENYESPDGEYPYGNIKDNDGSGNGTPANKETFADIFQFFAKMCDAAGIIPTGVPDNEYDGWQFFEALMATRWPTPVEDWAALPMVNNWINEGSGSYYDLEAAQDNFNNTLLRGHIKRGAASTGEGVVITTLPSDYWPAKNMRFVVPAFSDGVYGGKGAVEILINTSGEVIPYEMKSTATLLSSLNNVGDYLCLDGIRFQSGV
jgi:hypothetical protein